MITAATCAKRVNTGRAFALGLWLSLMFAGVAYAHALPGSVLVLTQGENRLDVLIRLPVEDLLVAAPALQGLESLSPGDDIPDELTSRIAKYFGSHTALSQAGVQLPLSLSDAHLEQDHNEHVGTYTVLSISMNASVTNAHSVTLTYSAVMHEVRNHRASIFWKEGSNESHAIAHYGYKQVAANTHRIEIHVNK